jgi:hypothetical protein
VFRFANGYGASVLTPDPRGGDAEIAVIEFIGPGPYDYALTYATPVTGDVVRADAPEVPGILSRIASLS